MTEASAHFITRAKVAAVVAQSQLALNAGSNSGVREGDTAVLYRHVEVTDPDTGETLGRVSFPRLSLRVNHVQEKMAIAKVTDHLPVAQDSRASISVRRLKKVTDDPMDENKETVLVTIGEEILIRREPTGDEPPF